MTNNEAYKAVSQRAHALMAQLAAEVPGDLRRVVSASLGIESGPPTDPFINPPAKPIGWATQLLALACEAYGRPLDRAVPVGACLEFFGIAAALLDAAQDGHEDLLNRYVGAVDDLPVTPGVAWDRRAALVSNASVALIGLFWRALLDYGPVYSVEQETLISIGRLIAERLVQICHGQHLDLTAGCDAQISLDQYEQIVINKTGAIDGLACEVGALLAGADLHQNLWRTIGMERAVAQQLYDDYVDLAEDLTGSGQVTHPVLYGLTVGSDEERDTIVSLLDATRARGALGNQAAAQLGTLLRTLGAEHYTLACMVVHRDRAIDALQALQLPSEADPWLLNWIMQADPLHASAADPKAEVAPHLGA